MLVLKILLIITQFNSIHNPSTPLPNRYMDQDQQVIYSLNEYVTSNIVKQGQEVPWGPTKRVQSSYVLIRAKPDGLTYLKVTIGGQFAYGGYFKYLGKEGNDFKYKRTDETAKEDYLFVNYKLSDLSSSQKYDESIIMKMLNFQTSYGLFMKF